MSSLTARTRECMSRKCLSTSLAEKKTSVHTAQIGDEHEKCMTPSLACLLASDTGYPLGNLSRSKAVRRRRA